MFLDNLPKLNNLEPITKPQPTSNLFASPIEILKQQIADHYKIVEILGN